MSAMFERSPYSHPPPWTRITIGKGPWPAGMYASSSWGWPFGFAYWIPESTRTGGGDWEDAAGDPASTVVATHRASAQSRRITTRAFLLGRSIRIRTNPPRASIRIGRPMLAGCARNVTYRHATKGGARALRRAPHPELPNRFEPLVDAGPAAPLRHADRPIRGAVRPGRPDLAGLDGVDEVRRCPEPAQDVRLKLAPDRDELAGLVPPVVVDHADLDPAVRRDVVRQRVRNGVGPLTAVRDHDVPGKRAGAERKRLRL